MAKEHLMLHIENEGHEIKVTAFLDRSKWGGGLSYWIKQSYEGKPIATRTVDNWEDVEYDIVGMMRNLDNKLWEESQNRSEEGKTNENTPE